MNEKSTSSVHWSFWVVGVVALIWNAGGCMAYMAEMDPSTFEATARALIENRPAWATGAFAIAVWGGALGSVILLLRKSLAFYVFVASFLGVAVQWYYNFFMGGGTGSYGPRDIAMAIMIPVIGAFLIWYTKMAESKGWIS
jgi:hypothetical protein